MRCALFLAAACVLTFILSLLAFMRLESWVYTGRIWWPWREP